MCDCYCELSKYDKWEQIKREHAHELAEKIRASTREAYGDPNPNTTYYEGDAAMGAANLIDPATNEAP